MTLAELIETLQLIAEQYVDKDLEVLCDKSDAGIYGTYSVEVRDISLWGLKNKIAAIIKVDYIDYP